MKYTIISEKGKYRELNEDAAAVFNHPDGSVMCALCDGMGGYENGEVASNLVIKIFKEEFQNIKPGSMSSEKIKKWFSLVLKKIIKIMKTMATDEHNFNAMGTTATIVISSGYCIYAISIGDSRLYIYRKRKIDQIFSDQNVRNLILKRGLPLKEALVHPQNHALFSSLGPNKFHLMEFYWERGWRRNLLLTSDGVHDYLNSQWIHKVLTDSEMSLEEKAKKLINQAEINGSKDNLTVLIMERDYYGK